MSPVLSSKYRREVKELPVAYEAPKKETIKEPAISPEKQKPQAKVKPTPKDNTDKEAQIESVSSEK